MSIPKFNQVDCFTRRLNTGTGKGCYNQTPTIYWILRPKSSPSITAAQADDMATHLKTMLINDDPSLRYRAIGRFSGLDYSGGEEEQRETYDDGTSKVTRDATGSWLNTITKGTSCKGAVILSYDQSQDIYDIIRVERSGVIDGQMSRNETTNALEFVGYSAQEISAKTVEEATFTTAPKFRIQATLVDPKSDYINKMVLDCSNLRIAQILEQYQVQDATIAESTVSVAAGTHKFWLTGPCGGGNLGKEFATELGDDLHWTLTNKTTGVAVAMTSVTFNTATGEGTVVMTTPPSAGTVLLFKGKSISDWATAGVKYYETNTIELTIIP